MRELKVFDGRALKERLDFPTRRSFRNFFFRERFYEPDSIEDLRHNHYFFKPLNYPFFNAFNLPDLELIGLDEWQAADDKSKQKIELSDGRERISALAAPVYEVYKEERPYKIRGADKKTLEILSKYDGRNSVDILGHCLPTKDGSTPVILLSTVRYSGSEIENVFVPKRDFSPVKTCIKNFLKTSLPASILFGTLVTGLCAKAGTKPSFVDSFVYALPIGGILGATILMYGSVFNFLRLSNMNIVDYYVKVPSLSAQNTNNNSNLPLSELA